ncbi:MAG: SoxR reducing system RseC family protein [bacterium]|nr:SoxR reducing system RseC family protein [bacterium]
MPAEEGIVTGLEGPYALVKVVRSAGCAHCPSAASCHLESDQTMIIKAQNSVGAKVGQRVQLFVAPRSILAASFLLYLLPLAGLMVGALVGKMLFSPVVGSQLSEFFAAGIGLGVMIAVFVGLRLYDRRRKSNKRFMPQIIQVL